MSPTARSRRCARCRSRSRDNEIVTIIGANGAGKTTLLNAIMGILPLTGGVTFAGEDMARLEIEDRVAAGLSLVPEHRELFGTMNVEDNLQLGAFRIAKAIAAQSFERVYTLFPRLKERRKQLAGTLSGGEQQMLAMGRALMGAPKLLMLDEPSLGLAPIIVADIFRTIGELRAAGVSVLLVEQNAQAALKIADRAYVMELGEFILNGPASDIATNRAWRRAISALRTRARAGFKSVGVAQRRASRRAHRSSCSRRQDPVRRDGCDLRSAAEYWTPAYAGDDTQFASLRRNVLPVLHGQDDARAVIEAVAVLFGEVVDALARRHVLFAQQGLADAFAEFRRARLAGLQRHRNDALENFEGVVGMAGELAAAVGAVFGLIGGVEREARLLGQRAVGLGLPATSPDPTP